MSSLYQNHLTVDVLASGLLHDFDGDHGHAHDRERGKLEITYTFGLTTALGAHPEYSALNERMIARHEQVFADVSALTELTFRETEPTEEPDFYFTFREDVDTAYVVSYLKGVLHVYNPVRDTPQLGSYTDHLILHEVGHGLGLGHGHDPGTLPEAYQGHAWTVMSYRAHPETDSLYYSDSHGPETYMLADIAALQSLYGANYATAAGDTVYTVDFETGEFFIDGKGQGVPINNETLRTIWDGGGLDTLDLSNAVSGLSIDLRPGGFTSFGDDFVAYQGIGRDGQLVFAPGNLAKAYLYDENPASLLENAIGGDFSDTLKGNVVDNRLDGGDGNDTILGMEGDDQLLGRAGDDIIVDGLGDTFARGGTGDDFIVALSGAGDLYGDNGGDVIVGGVQDDILEGGEGDDVLRGDAGSGLLFGSDLLIGGTGDDLLMGGRGADAFEFSPDGGDDVIGAFDSQYLDPHDTEQIVPTGADFQSGVDKIVLAGFFEVTQDSLYEFLEDDAATGAARFAAEGTSIVFVGLSVEDLQQEDFVFL